MAQSTHDSAAETVTGALKGSAWLAFAAIVAAAAGWAAYDRLGGIDTPVQKAGVVGAALLGLGAAMWTKKVLLIALYAGVIILAIWAADHYWLHA